MLGRFDTDEHSYQCPFCDGLEDSGHPVGLLGFPSPAYKVYGLAGLRFDDRVTIFANGDSPSDEPTIEAMKTLEACGVKVEQRRVRRLIDNGPGPENGITVELEDGEKVRCGCVFHHPHTVNRAQDLLDQLGIETTPVNEMMGMGGEAVMKNQFNETNVPGVFAAGDTMTPYKAVCGALAAGNTAGVGVCMTLAFEEGAKALASKS